MGPLRHQMDAKLPSQAGPQDLIRLPGQTRVSPEEYKEFLQLGHGDIFELNPDRSVMGLPWHDGTFQPEFEGRLICAHLQSRLTDQPRADALHHMSIKIAGRYHDAPRGQNELCSAQLHRRLSLNCDTWPGRHHIKESAQHQQLHHACSAPARHQVLRCRAQLQCSWHLTPGAEGPVNLCTWGVCSLIRHPRPWSVPCRAVSSCATHLAAGW